MSETELRSKRIVHVSRGVVRVSGHSIVTVRRAPEDAPEETPPRSAPEPKPASFRDRIIEKKDEG